MRVNLEVHGVRDMATERGKGSGTAVMRELIRAADRHSREITLKAASRRGAHGIEELVAYLGGPSRVRLMMTRSPQ